MRNLDARLAALETARHSHTPQLYAVLVQEGEDWFVEFGMQGGASDARSVAQSAPHTATER